MISSLLSVVGAGARKNKYRVIVPTLNSLDGDMNTLCSATSLPGRSLTPTEVIVKGKKAQLRGETSYDGTWEMTIYNTEDMKIRDFFISWMSEVHNTNANPGALSTNRFIGAALDVANGVNSFISNPFGLGGAPTYQRDIKIEQLDNKGNEIYEMFLKGAFPISVSSIDLDAQVGEISTTVITFAYTDIEIGDINSKLLGVISGDAAGNLF